MKNHESLHSGCSCWNIYKKKPTSSHDTIEIIKHKTTVKTDSSTQLCCRSFKFYKAHCRLKIYCKNYYYKIETCALPYRIIFFLNWKYMYCIKDWIHSFLEITSKVLNIMNVDICMKDQEGDQCHLLRLEVKRKSVLPVLLIKLF